jgi:hypothetical protein
MYIPRNWEFGQAFSKLRNFGRGGVEPPKHPPGYASDLRSFKGVKRPVTRDKIIIIIIIINMKILNIESLAPVYKWGDTLRRVQIEEIRASLIVMLCVYLLFRFAVCDSLCVLP